jgi:hypothetical protein
MPYHFSRTEQYRQKIDECIAMAKASTSNKVRAHYYKTAAHYLHLLEADAKLVAEPRSPIVQQQALTGLSALS